MTHRILLADDSVTIRKVVELTFSDEDFTIDSVGDGTQALEHARTQRPDIVISDVIMPGLNGYELCQQVKADPNLQTVPFLFLKGTFESFDEEKARSCGADGFIVKPFESQELIAKVKDLIAWAGSVAPAAPVQPPLRVGESSVPLAAAPPPAATRPMPSAGEVRPAAAQPAPPYVPPQAIPARPAPTPPAPPVSVPPRPIPPSPHPIAMTPPTAGAGPVPPKPVMPQRAPAAAPVAPPRPAVAPPPIPTVQTRPAPVPPSPVTTAHPAPPAPPWPTRPVDAPPAAVYPPLPQRPPIRPFSPPPPPPPPPAPAPPAARAPIDDFGFDFGESEGERFGDIVPPAAPRRAAAPVPEPSGESDEDLWSEVSLRGGGSDLLEPHPPAGPDAGTGAGIMELAEESAITAPEVLFEDEAVFEEVTTARMEPPVSPAAPPAPRAEAPETTEPVAAVSPPLAPPAAPVAIDQAEIERIVASRVEAAVRQILEPVVSDLARTMIEAVAWEVIPDLAEAMIKAEIERVRQSTRTD
jgi:CheY-like chemotaxis protein